MHPMLIPLPIACVIGALVCDIVAKAGLYTGWYFMAYVLTIGAWATGLLAAVPGLIDYFKAVPSGTRAKRDATVHMVLNVTIVGLYFVSWLIKNATGGPDTSWAALILEIIGTGALTASGWYGWTLVYKHRMGIDEGYAPEDELRSRERRIA